MVKYPTGSLTYYTKDQTDFLHPGKQKHRKDVVFSDRGMSLEQQTNESSKYCLLGDIAVVHKESTPAQIVRIDYPKRSRTVIKEAYFRQASTTNYNGVYQNRYLDSEAKETRDRRSFPLKSFHEHQIIHLEKCLKRKGICFTIIHLVALNRCFITPASFVIKAWEIPHKSSMTVQELINDPIEIKSGSRPTLPYLDAIDNFIDRNKENDR